tara:strand:+ start:91 stop:234 length:144 start_codon:yes stop_codon:yes gene_type:complete
MNKVVKKIYATGNIKWAKSFLKLIFLVKSVREYKNIQGTNDTEKIAG